MTKTAKEQYEEFMGDEVEIDPLERLRFFCSLAMKNQDWLDVEPFFDAVSAESQLLRKDAMRYRWLRNQNWRDNTLCAVISPQDAVRLGCYAPSLERLNAYIDAAVLPEKVTL